VSRSCFPYSLYLPPVNSETPVPFTGRGSSLLVSITLLLLRFPSRVFLASRLPYSTFLHSFSPRRPASSAGGQARLSGQFPGSFWLFPIRPFPGRRLPWLFSSSLPLFPPPKRRFPLFSFSLEIFFFPKKIKSLPFPSQLCRDGGRYLGSDVDCLPLSPSSCFLTVQTSFTV